VYLILNKHFVTNIYPRAFSQQSIKRRLYFLPRYFYFSHEDNFFMFPSRQARRNHSSRNIKQCKIQLQQARLKQTGKVVKIIKNVYKFV